jgi:two-component system sensor kinase FixL
LLQYLNIIGISQPNHELLNNDSSFADVAGYSVIFTIFAIIAWLSGSKMEHTLERAIKAEENLQKERDELARRVEAQTKRIIDAQQKELKQLYKFAELGQLTAIILHELANNLSILTLDIDDLKERHENSIAIEHAKESIYYIDTIIDQLRNQIKDSDDIIKFDACKNTKDCLDQLKHKLNSSDIILNSQVRDSTDSLIIGDPLRLSQAIIILMTNAAQAHQNGHSEIYVDISSTKANVLISVKDFGTGISQDARRDLFQPQKSKKNGSLGIGLYITKQIIVTHFKGHIWLSPATEYTQFNIEIPKANKGIKRLRSQNARTAPTPHT